MRRSEHHEAALGKVLRNPPVVLVLRLSARLPGSDDLDRQLPRIAYVRPRKSPDRRAADRIRIIPFRGVRLLRLPALRADGHARGLCAGRNFSFPGSLFLRAFPEPDTALLLVPGPGDELDGGARLHSFLSAERENGSAAPRLSRERPPFRRVPEAGNSSRPDSRRGFSPGRSC